MIARIFGVVLCMIGVVLTLGILWIVQHVHFFSVRLVAIGPMLISMGIGVVVFGKSMFGEGNAEKPPLRAYLILGVGAIAGAFLSQAVKEGNFTLLEKSRTLIEEKAGVREHMITREEIDTAVASINSEGAELQKTRAALNVQDAGAMAKFEAAAAAYNQRNKEVREMVAKYQEQAKKTQDYRAKLIGAWKYEFAITEGWDTKSEIAATSVFGADGVVHVDALATTEKGRRELTWSGRWEVEGDTLRMTVDAANPYSGTRPGDVIEHRIIEINDAEFRYRELHSGTEMIRYRIKDA